MRCAIVHRAGNALLLGPTAVVEQVRYVVRKDVCYRQVGQTIAVEFRNGQGDGPNPRQVAVRCGLERRILSLRIGLRVNKEACAPARRPSAGAMPCR